ncbi:hypothetical protein U1Q18_000917 [Sarracenia purpurea var. burkii]
MTMATCDWLICDCLVPGINQSWCETSLYNGLQAHRLFYMARDCGRVKTTERDGRNIQVKEKSKGIYKGFTAGARCGVDDVTRFGGQHFPKDLVLEIAGRERRSKRENRDANIDG